MMLTDISSNPSSILITGSFFLLTLIRSSFSSLDSTLPTPFHSCSFATLRSNLIAVSPNYFALFPFHLVSYTHNTPTFLVSIISAKLPSSSRHRPNIQTAHSHSVTVQMPQKKRNLWRLNILPLKQNREENNIHLFTGSIMDPFKNGPTGLFATALVSLGKSGTFHLVWYHNRPQLQTGQFRLARIVSSLRPRFHRSGMDRNCLKIGYGDSVLQKMRK